MSGDDTTDCVVKHCDEPATLGMTIWLAGLRLELDLCERHFDALAAADQTDSGRPQGGSDGRC